MWLGHGAKQAMSHLLSPATQVPISAYHKLRRNWRRSLEWGLPAEADRFLRGPSKVSAGH